MPIETLSRPETTEFAEFYAPYLARVPEADALPALEGQLAEVIPLLESISEARAGHRYAPEKWSIRQVVGHLSDAERVFAYRMFRFSRRDETPLAGFDEDHFVAHGGYDGRTLRDLTTEFMHLRGANLHMIRGFDPPALTLAGSANGHPISVRALAFIMVGHVRHHLSVLKERYL
jgi:hypothetical protein